jgi:predicted phosphodiesterase
MSCSHKIQFDKIKILVIGDVQLKSNIKRYNSKEWLNQKLDTFQFSKLFNEVLKTEKPDFIFQTGDWVNYNNGLFLKVIDTIGNEISLLPLPYDEWKFMNSTIPKELQENFFMAFGNHDSYKEIILQGIFVPNADILANIEEVKLDIIKSEDKREFLINKFKGLKNARFHNHTGTYTIEKDKFTLISFDGLDRNRMPLLDYLEDELSKHQKFHPEKKLIVISHYPIFTGRQKNDDEKLVLSDIRDSLIQLFDKYKVDVYINGHEHYYLRYNSEGIKKGAFGDIIPNYTTYMTVSNFANPYAREFKRLMPNEYNDNSLIYFNGIHYSTIIITDTSLQIKTYGLFENSTWKMIDYFKM